jgi:hypothetical protein
MMAAGTRWMTASFPALASLGLRGEHLSALARQGSLRAENAPRGKSCHKLRFRMGPKQYVRYIGSNPQFVDQVRQELMRLQAPAKSRRQLQRLIREANECLRRTKHQVEPLLPLAGRCFYGREIRWQPGHGSACVDGNESPW